MKRYRVRLTDEAKADLAQIYRYVRLMSASSVVARGYTARIRSFLAGFQTFPERGTKRDQIREGLRLIGFERRVSVAFLVETDEVVILRVLYAGRHFESDAPETSPAGPPETDQP
jgi:plasmid stabilization system protein ParE